MSSGPRIGGLFAGYGGLEIAVHSVLGGELTWYSESDTAACKVLAYHHPDVPNLGDITTIDWNQAEPVDVLIGGFPCQDLSLAGRQAGLRPGTRSGLWSHMAYAIDKLRPRLVVAENVRGILSASAHSDLEPCPWCLGDDEHSNLRALGRVLGDLADLGYNAVWCGLRAADVGAPHGRFRIFVAAADTKGDRHRYTGPASLGGVPQAALAGDQRDAVANTDQQGRQGAEPARRPDLSARSAAADIDREPEGTDWGPYGPAIARWAHILGRPAPAPTTTGRRGARVLNPVFVEWLMGLELVRATGVPRLSRSDMLKVLGNGVVPQQGSAALRCLLPLIATAVGRAA